MDAPIVKYFTKPEVARRLCEMSKNWMFNPLYLDIELWTEYPKFQYEAKFRVVPTRVQLFGVNGYNRRSKGSHQSAWFAPNQVPEQLKPVFSEGLGQLVQFLEALKAKKTHEIDRILAKIAEAVFSLKEDTHETT